ncbi:MAG: DNA-processing protein DprA [Bacteroidetes bacterium]|nr:DNA-processing protein DprA [Bacteroidota bacterium]
MTENLIADLAEYDVSIISGLAYGIDIAAHKSALKHNLPHHWCIGSWLAHYLSSSAQKYCRKMQLGRVGILTEYAFKTIADKGISPNEIG